ncbi:MAG: ATP-binding protein [Cyanobacteria bacterium J06628_6]
MTQSSSVALSLPRTLSSLETFGFGFGGLLLWLGTAPAMHAALGPMAVLVWIPGTIIGVLLNLQVQHLGRHLADVAGGTPNYTTYLLRRYPALARYAAMGYFLGWISVPAMNAIILTDLIDSNLSPLGIHPPIILLRVCFLMLPFIMAFSGTRTLGILHAFFAFPAIGLLLLFCLQGLGWLSFAPSSPSFFPSDWGEFSLLDWMKWFYIAVYAVYGCETESSFVADSRRPDITLRCLSLTASCIPIVYVGGSWLLMRLDDGVGLGDSTFLHMAAASQNFWGAAAPALVTFLVASGCLLSSATAASNCPRVLYQLSKDRYLPPLFSVVSNRVVFVPGLIFTLSLSLISLSWGDISRVVMVTGTGYLMSMMAIHLGAWVSRKDPASRWPWLSLGFFLLEGSVLIVGGIAWGWQDWLIGLLMPAVVAAIATQLPRLRIAPLHPSWWVNRVANPPFNPKADWVALQVAVIILLVCSAVSVGWFVRSGLAQLSGTASYGALFSITLVIGSFVGVAIACWTSLPQIAAITEARDQVEQTLGELQQTQTQLVQAEKMSSLGQLVAGIAHEINNPVNFIHGNLRHIQGHSQALLELIYAYQVAYPDPPEAVKETEEEIELDFVQEDLQKIMQSMKIGSDRIREIVLSLRTFSRLDEAEFKNVNVHEGIDSTLMILRHRLKASPPRPAVEIIRDYDHELPLVACYPGQLNQVIMNILANAIDAVEDKLKQTQGTDYQPQITLRTGRLGQDWLEIAIVDNGPGIPPAVQKRIFEPFFTTKAVGKGTGMGMSISYQIIVEKHQGKLSVSSQPGEGTEFAIAIPIRQENKRA